MAELGAKGFKLAYFPFCFCIISICISAVNAQESDQLVSGGLSKNPAQSSTLNMSLEAFVALKAAERKAGIKPSSHQKTAGPAGVDQQSLPQQTEVTDPVPHASVNGEGVSKKVVSDEVDVDISTKKSPPVQSDSHSPVTDSNVKSHSGDVKRPEIIFTTIKPEQAEAAGENAGSIYRSKAEQFTEKKADNASETASYAVAFVSSPGDQRQRSIWSNNELSADRANGFWQHDLAPVSGTLNIFAAVQRAVAYHPDIAESLGGLYEQKETVSEARANYLPQISSGVRSGYRTSSDRTDEAFNVNVSQLLYDFGKVSSTVDAAEAGVIRDRAALLLTVDDLARDTARAFVEVQRYEELVEIAGQFVSAVGDIQNLAAKRSAKGASSRSDEIQAKSRRHAAQATAMQYQSRLDVWTTTLTNLIGASNDIDTVGEFPSELNGFCERATEHFDQVPSIVMAEAEKAIAKANIKNAKSEIMPTLSLKADYDHFFNEAGDQPIGDDEYFTFTLDLQSKLYEGGAISSRRRSAEYALNRAIAAKKSAFLDVERTLREAKVQSRILARRIKTLNNRYEDIVKTQELYRQQYLSLGTRTLLDILNTEAEIFQSLFDIKNNFYELELLQIDCLHSVAEIRDAFSINTRELQGVRIGL